jgi:hypothetical protein
MKALPRGDFIIFEANEISPSVEGTGPEVFHDGGIGLLAHANEIRVRAV